MFTVGHGGENADFGSAHGLHTEKGAIPECTLSNLCGARASDRQQ